MGTSLRETAGVEDAGYESAGARNPPDVGRVLAPVAWAVTALFAVAGATWLLAVTPLGVVAAYALVVLLPVLAPALVVWQVTAALG